MEYFIIMLQSECCYDFLRLRFYCCPSLYILLQCGSLPSMDCTSWRHDGIHWRHWAVLSVPWRTNFKTTNHTSTNVLEDPRTWKLTTYNKYHIIRTSRGMNYEQHVTHHIRVRHLDTGLSDVSYFRKIASATMRHQSASSSVSNQPPQHQPHDWRKIALASWVHRCLPVWQQWEWSVWELVD